MSTTDESIRKLPPLRKLIAAATLSGAAGLFAPALAAAADFEVNSLADTSDGSCLPLAAGDCTLREAINAADVAGSPNIGGNDRITFASVLSGDIQLLSALPNIDEGVDIIGPGTQLAIDGQASYRPLYISAGADSVTIEGLTIKNGSHPNSGGAISAAATGGLTLRGVAITDNRTTANGAEGGGVAAVDTPLTVIDSILSGNAAPSINTAMGGAIFINGADLDISGSEIEGSFAEFEGGGIYADQSAVTIADSTISGSSTDRNAGKGGGIYVSYGSLEISGSTISGNFTTGGGASGGGISTYRAGTTITDSTISGNYTSGDGGDGGGLAVYAGDLTLAGSTLVGNSTSGNTSDGAGISLGDGSDPGVARRWRISNSTISGNRTLGPGSDGGGMKVEFDSQGAAHELSIDSSTVTGNEASGNGNPGPTGGGIVLNNSDIGDGSTLDATLNNTIVAGNAATGDGQDLFSETNPGDPFTLTNSLVGTTDGAEIDPASSNDITGTDPAPVEPLLDPLADNGGPTFTHALQPASPAIDSGSTALAIDQRGIARPQAAVDDIGAYELDVAPSATITSAPSGRTADNTPTITFSSPDPDLKRFECSLDGAAFVTCASPLTVGPLADGAHTFEIRAVDTADNTGQRASVSFTIDTTTPTEPTPPTTEPTIPDNELLRPRVRLAGKLFVKGKQFKIKVGAGAAEAVRSRADATLIENPKGKGKAKKTKLRGSTRATTATETTNLPLQYKGGKSKRQRLTRKLKRTLQRGKTRVTVRVKVKLTDEAGNSVTEKRTARVKAKK